MITRASVAVLIGGLLLTISALSQQALSQGTQPAATQRPATTQPVAATQPPVTTQPPQQQGLPPAISVTTTEIIVPVTVIEAKTGKFVSNLGKDDFRIEDEGRPQDITYFYHDTPGLRQHTVIGFLVDTSSSNMSHWDKFKDATKDLIWGLMPNDPNYTGYLISYNTRAQLEVNTTQVPEQLTERMDRLKPGGGAALYNAVYKACTDRKLVPGEPYQPRRVIIVVGDGHDTASDYTLDQVIELAQRNLVTVYGISTVSFGASSEDSDNLERLAKETGGKVEYPLNNPYSNVSGFLSQPSDEGNYALKVGTGGYTSAIATAINNTVMSMQGELTNQYILRYVPHIDPKTSYKDRRNIKVDVMSLPGGSVTVRARQYYYARPVSQ